MTRFYIVPVEDEERNLDTRYVGQIRSFPELIQCRECGRCIKAKSEDEYDSCEILFEMVDVPLCVRDETYCAWGKRKKE